MNGVSLFHTFDDIAAPEQHTSVRDATRPLLVVRLRRSS